MKLLNLNYSEFEDDEKEANFWDNDYDEIESSTGLDQEQLNIIFEKF